MRGLYFRKEFRKALTEDELTFGQRWERTERGRQAQSRGRTPRRRRSMWEDAEMNANWA